MMANPRPIGISCCLAFAILGALGGVNGGCSIGHFCTLVGCADRAQVTLRTMSGTWPAGTYAIDVTVDGTAGTCTFATTDPSGTWQVSCSPAVQGYLACRSMGFEGGCSSVPPQLLLELSFLGTPAQITLNVSRDGRPVGAGTFAPKYTVFQPNGPDCAPTCHAASSDCQWRTDRFDRTCSGRQFTGLGEGHAAPWHSPPSLMVTVG